MIDYDSFSPCWIRLKYDYTVIATSESFVQFNWINKSLWDHCELKQPAIHSKLPDLNELYSRILILFIPEINTKFRGTIHKMEKELFFRLSPIASSLEELKKLTIPLPMNHPGCVAADLLILKDVIAKSNEKIRKLENKSIKLELEHQKNVNKHQSKLASIGELSASIAHEINNPLTIALGNLELYQREVKRKNLETESLTKFIQKQKVAFDRIKRIVTSLRTYSRSDENQSLEDFILKDSLKEVFLLIQDIYKKNNVDLAFNYPDEGIKIHGIPGEFQQVLLNLIKNAKDSLEESEKKEISVSVEVLSPEELVIKIKDTGSGIDDEIKEKIFEQFFTSKPVGVGTGLGLGICRDIIEHMGGTIRFESEKEIGTTFFIRLPYST